MTSLVARWPKMFANHNYLRVGNEVTWPNRVRFDTETTPDLLATLIENRQFSLQVVEDGSIFQFYYAFANNGQLLEASLGFVFAGIPPEAIGDPFAEGVMPIAVPESHPGWVRLDFDPKAGQDCLHYHSHLHLSVGADVRIAVRRIPTPKQFVEMIIAWFYPEAYRANRLANGEFQLPNEDSRVLFEEIMPVQEGIPSLTGIHISVP